MVYVKSKAALIRRKSQKGSFFFSKPGVWSAVFKAGVAADVFDAEAEAEKQKGQSGAPETVP
jgi:hypothetical protein